MLDPNRILTSDILISFTLDDDGEIIADDVVQLDTEPANEEE